MKSQSSSPELDPIVGPQDSWKWQVQVFCESQSKIVQQVKAFVTKPNGQSAIPGSVHVVGREKGLP